MFHIFVCTMSSFVTLNCDAFVFAKESNALTSVLSLISLMLVPTFVLLDDMWHLSIHVPKWFALPFSVTLGNVTTMTRMKQALKLISSNPMHAFSCC